MIDFKELLKARPSSKIGFEDDLELLKLLSKSNPSILDNFPFMIFVEINESIFDKIFKV